MHIVEPHVIVETPIDRKLIMRQLELFGRNAYKSEGKVEPGSAKRFLQMILKRGHESVIEHLSLTVRFICNRGVTHELVRHRLAAYTQESTRFCNYSGGEFGEQITVVRPFWIEPGSSQHIHWDQAMRFAEETYLRLLQMDQQPQQARGVLPIDLKTEIVTTFNLRQWRHFFRMRTGPEVHPQMRQVTLPLLAHLQLQLPVIFPPTVGVVSDEVPHAAVYERTWCEEPPYPAGLVREAT